MLKNNPKTINILLAEDDVDDRDFFEQAIKEMDFNCKLNFVTNGRELIDYLDESEVPHIVFLDLNMPIVSGMEALKILRHNQKYSRLVIAIYSTSSNERDIEFTLAQGANCYIIKPNKFSKLKKILKHVLSMQWQFHSNNLSIDNFVIVVN